MIVDSHQHFWRYDAEEYDWIDDELATVRRDFLPRDLAREIGAAGVDAVVSVARARDVRQRLAGLPGRLLVLEVGGHGP